MQLDIRNAYTELDETCPKCEYEPTRLYHWLIKVLHAVDFGVSLCLHCCWLAPWGFFGPCR